MAGRVRMRAAASSLRPRNTAPRREPARSSAWRLPSIVRSGSPYGFACRWSAPSLCAADPGMMLKVLPAGRTSPYRGKDEITQSAAHSRRRGNA
jgi:hypothetical protein